MTVFASPAVRIGMLNAITTEWGAGAKLRVYSGTVPADQTVALGAQVMLAECTPTPAAASAAGQVVTKDMLGGAKTGTGTAGAGAGTQATFYRVVKADGTTVVEQGTLGTSGADLTIDNTSIATNQVVNFNAWVKTQP